MSELSSDDFYCPSCGKVPEKNELLLRGYSFVAFHAPYFVCGACGICAYSEDLLKNAVAAWAKRCDIDQPELLYPSIASELEEHLAYFISRGFRRKDFIFKKK